MTCSTPYQPEAGLPARRLAAALAACALMTAPEAFAQDETAADNALKRPRDTVVVLGSLTPRPVEQMGSAISVVGEADLQLRQINLVSDVLREVPGVAVNRSGPQGAATQVRIRGAEGNHTLVFIDGVEANSPISGEFNFANLVAADVEQIEVLRGAQSALYGSEAIGGVIAVTTKAPEQGFQAEGEFEVGSFGAKRFFTAVGGGNEIAGLRAALQYYDADGVSVSPSGSEADGFNNRTVSVKGVLQPADQVRIESVVRYVDSDVDTDAQEFSFGSVLDANQHTQSEDLFAKIDAAASLLDGAASVRGYVGYTESEVANFADGGPNGLSRGERLEYGLSASGAITAGAVRHGLTVGIERELLDFRNESPFLAEPNVQDDAQTSLVAEYTLDVSATMFLSAAVRQDYNDLFDDATTYRVSGAYLLGRTGARLHASWGEGVADPGFTERFGFDPSTFVGNPDLQPERSQGFDIGIEQSLFGGAAVIDVTYFEANLEDEIATNFSVFPFTAINLPGESERSGVEVSVQASLSETLSLDGHYSQLDASGADNLSEVRRPETIASINLNWRNSQDRARLNIGLAHNGENEDNYFGFADPNFTPRRTLKAYTLARVAGSYKINEHAEVFARGENVLDEDYQEVLGFASQGAAAYVGVRLKR